MHSHDHIWFVCWVDITDNYIICSIFVCFLKYGLCFVAGVWVMYFRSTKFRGTTHLQ